MKILFVHEVNYLNKVVFEMHEFPELLSLRGHDVSFFHYPEAPDRPLLTVRTKSEVIAGRVHSAAKIRLVTPPTLGGRPFERVLAPMLAWLGLRREIKHGHYDAIVLYAVPTSGWLAIRFARRFQTPLVYRALDVSHLIRRTFFAPLVKMAERYVYRQADLISANNPALMEYCADYSGRRGGSVVNVAPIDLSHFATSPRDSARKEVGLSDEHRVVLYMGTFFRFSGLDVLLRSMAPMFAADRLLRLVLVGAGEMEIELRSIAVELGVVDRVIFTGLVPYADLPRYLKMATVAVNPFVPELTTDVAFPHKVLQYLAAGIPTVSTSLKGLRGVLGDASGVTWVANAAEVAAAATQLAKLDGSQLFEIGSVGRRFIAETFSQDNATAAFETMLTRLAKQS